MNRNRQDGMRMILGILAFSGLAAGAGELLVDKLNVKRESRLNGDVSVSNSVRTVGGRLIVHYSFDSDSGDTVNDSSGLGLHATASTSGWTRVSPGYNGSGYAFQLDGTGYAAAPYSTNYHMANFTLTAWVKTPGAGTARRRIVSHQYDNWWLMALNGNRLELGSSSAGILQEEGDALNDDAWHFVAVVRDSENFAGSWYVDGTNIATTSFSSDAPDASSAQPLYIGRLWDNGGENFTGTLDDIRVYSRALTAAEILGLRNGTNPAVSTLAIVTNGAVTVATPARFEGETTILNLKKQGDIEMGIYTNRP